MAEQQGLPDVPSKAATLAELEKRRKELTAQIEAGRADAIAEIVAYAISQAAQIGVDVAELVQAFGKVGSKPGKKPTAGIRAPAPEKYRNPKNAAETWSGRGRYPAWVRDALAAGATLESLAI
jgi:DNA-binding protein H-NS